MKLNSPSLPSRAAAPRPIAPAPAAARPAHPLLSLQQQAGNRATRSLLDARSGEAPPPRTRRRVETALGADLRGVRLHTGEASQRAARSLDAHAFTIGQDVHFAQGMFKPGTPGGDGLIIHELVHTVQQRGQGDAAREVSRPGDPAEQEAETLARGILSNRRVGPVRQSTSSISRGGASGKALDEYGFNKREREAAAENERASAEHIGIIFKRAKILPYLANSEQASWSPEGHIHRASEIVFEELHEQHLRESNPGRENEAVEESRRELEQRHAQVAAFNARGEVYIRASADADLKLLVHEALHTFTHSKFKEKFKNTAMLEGVTEYLAIETCKRARVEVPVEAYEPELRQVRELVKTIHDDFDVLARAYFLGDVENLLAQLNQWLGDEETKLWLGALLFKRNDIATKLLKFELDADEARPLLVTEAAKH